jgi:hypothetical protein
VHLALMKTPMGTFIPAPDQDEEELAQIKTGEVIHADFRKQRNSKFHRKFFAMIKVGFDHWEPASQEHHGLPVQKNRERFRKDCIIAAGFYDPVVALNGEVRAEAHSLKFSKMDDTEFEKVYSAVADVLLQKVLRTYTRSDLDQVVDHLLAFT